MTGARATAYIVIDPVEAETMRPATAFEDPDFVYRDVHPKHRPVWHGALWHCTCGRYRSDRLPDMQRHADRVVDQETDPTLPDLDPREGLPTTDPSSRRPHDADDCLCVEDPRCTYCGCCVHGMSPRAGCLMDQAPRGVYCMDPCGCEGRS